MPTITDEEYADLKAKAGRGSPPGSPEAAEDLNTNDAIEDSEMQRAWNRNGKRTFDVYQDFDVQAQRANQRTLDRYEQVSIQAMQNAVETANMVAKQAIRHSDVAADALWTDELNPVVRGAGDVMAGQAPVNSQLSSTASLDTAFMNLTAQNGELVTAVIGLANSVAAQNTAVTAALAQIVQNAKQAPTAAA
jgi:hypothetical protein